MLSPRARVAAAIVIAAAAGEAPARGGTAAARTRAGPGAGARADSPLSTLIEQLARDNYVLVPAEELWPLLSSLGARDDDIGVASGYWEEAVPQQDEHGNEVYPHKRTLTTYYDLSTRHGEFKVGRSTSEDSTRIAGHVIEHIDPTTINGGANGGLASYYRVHKAWPREADENSVIRAIQALVYGIMNSDPLRQRFAVESSRASSPSPSSPPVSEWEAMFSAFRVRRSATELGDPGPEGVHQVRAGGTAGWQTTATTGG